MVYGHIDEHPTSQSHRYREDPIRRPALRRGVDKDPNSHPDGARDREGKGVGCTGQQRAIRDHPEESDPHRDGCEDLVQRDRPQRFPRVGFCLRNSNRDALEDGVETQSHN